MTNDLAQDLVASVGEWSDDPDEPGVSWRLDVETDPETTINDYDTYGATRWIVNNLHGSVRPGWHTAGINAPHARILDRDRGMTLWWWPNIEQWGVDAATHDFASDFATVKRLYEDGFYGALLTRRTTCLCCDQAIDATSYLGGIDTAPSDDAGYWAEVVNDLAYDLEREPVAATHEGEDQ